MAQDEYFAQKETKEAITVLDSKISDWTNMLESNGYLELLRMSWLAYHGAYYRDSSQGHQITFSGEQGELANLPINDYRNLAQHIIVMTTSNRPALEARATNTDYRSLVQTYLANGLLDYYMREKKLEVFLKKAVEYAVVFGAGFIKMEWNALSGEIYEFNDETQTPIYEGDVVFSNLSPFDVVYDGTKENNDHDWVLVRTYKNRYDLAAKYPEYAEKIKGLPSKSDLYKYRLNLFQSTEETPDIPVFEFYHRRTESMPDGRYIMFLDKEIGLHDGPMPYRTLPIFRIAPGDILGTPYGYTSMFDVLPIQEATNSLFSTILSNQNAFGVQNVIVPRGSDINVTELVGGLNAIEVDMSKGKPEPLNLTYTPPELFKFLEMLQKSGETLSGVNSVARGNPEASLKSGAALALVQSMSLQFMSGLQQSYVQLIESVGTALIQMLQDFAKVPRIANIVGKSNRTFMKEFTGEDLNKVSRVMVDMGNPLSKTTAGRVQMAEQLLQMGLLKTPQDYLTIINTGKLDVATEDTQKELLLIQAENEKMVALEPVIAIDIDDHKMHIAHHKAILSDPDLRTNPQLVRIVLTHIQEHIDALRTSDPDLLMLLGQQPLQPAAPPPGQPGAEGQAPMEPPQPGALPESIQGPGMASPVSLPNVPQPATPPPPFASLPTSAEEAMPPV